MEYKGICCDANLHGATDTENVKFIKGFITPENFEKTIKENSIPLDFDFLSIDIDGNDIHLLDALKEYKPKLICVEVNGRNDKWNQDIVHPYSNSNGLNEQASIIAINNLMKDRGYTIVYNNEGNVYLVSNNYIDKFKKLTDENIKQFVNDAVEYYENDMKNPQTYYSHKLKELHTKLKYNQVCDKIEYYHRFVPMYEF